MLFLLNGDQGRKLLLQNAGFPDSFLDKSFELFQAFSPSAAHSDNIFPGP